MSCRGNNLETMFVSRRNFLAGAAALGSAPALGAPSASGETDVAIIGAGAAGIAAARKVAAAGRRFTLIEASDRVGGRCVTDTRTFGVPFDRGAHWVRFPGHQSGDAACGAQRTRHLSGAARAEAAHRKAQRARRRDGGLSRDAGAREPRDPGGGARQGRCSLHAGAAEGSGRLAARGGIRARAVHLRQGPR